MTHKQFTCMLLLLHATLAPAQTMLTPPRERISDAAIQADHQAYEKLQGRLKALNEGGRPLRNYHLAKAQCWLDVSFHEYTRNDRSAFPQAALSESEKLVQAMELRAQPLPGETPLVNDAPRLRPDLWQRAAVLGTVAGAACAQHKRACAEVELVHAGNEHKQQQWRHAQPYVQIAEDLLAEGEALAAACTPPPAPPTVAAVIVAPAPAPLPMPAPLPAPVLPPQQALTLGASVVFNFDRSGAKDMRPFSLTQLNALVARIKTERLLVSAIRLTGHADRLNGTRKADYNRQLAQQRVATVRDHLVSLGVDKHLLFVDAQGDSQPVQTCAANIKSVAELQECLLPNRRVEVVIEALRVPR